MEVPVGTGANGGEKDEAKGDGVQLEKGLARVEEEGVAESGPLAMHKVVISTGKSSREELDWAICDICPEMSEPTSMSILMTSP